MSASQTAAAFDRARKVADAVLYEGYVLYPYRASAAKNQVRWQFGVIAPRPYSEADGSEAWAMQTECVVEAAEHPVVDVKLRCLQVQTRRVEAAGVDGEFRPVDSIEVGGRLLTTWDEAVEQEVAVPGVVLDPVDTDWRREHAVPFEFPSGSEIEELAAEGQEAAGRLVRERQAVSGVVRVRSEWADGPYPLVKLHVRVENTTDWNVPEATRDEVVRRSLVAVHTLLAVRGGAFVSQIDPPEFAVPVVESCSCIGTYPVLAGPADERDVVLSSPIILYDHPEIAPESTGDLFDATEIDEILLLRTMTLTDEEKREVRGTDARGAAILDRIDDMPPEIFERLHGAVRYVGATPSEPEPVLAPEPAQPPWWDPGVDAEFNPAEDTIWIGRTEVGNGTRVRLSPSHRADAHDMFLAGKSATVQGVFHDVDDDVHVAVVLDDDPFAELQQWQRRFYYFRPDELEVDA
jgi:hypothetical protein